MANLGVLTNTGTRVELDPQEIDDFRSSFLGSLITPEDSGYEEARHLWNGLVDKRPALIVKAAGEDDVVAAVRFAASRDLKISVKGGGHNVAGHAMSEGGLTIDLSAMRMVTADPEARRATVQAGATLGDVDRVTQAYNLAVPLGLQSLTGVAGLTLHGGIGWLARKHGLSLDSVTALHVVTADGVLRRASEEQDPDLFWAVRGGGGNFGVVTAFEFRLHPVGPEVFVNLLAYPMENAEQVLSSFRDFVAGAPDEIGVISVLWTAEGPGFPEEARGAPVAIALAVHTGPIEEGEKFRLQLDVPAEPLLELHTAMPFVEVQQFFDADYPEGRLYYWKSLYLDRLDEEVVAALKTHARKRPSPLSSVDVWFLGARIERVGPTDTAFAQRRRKYMIGIEANWNDPSESQANIAWAREAFTDLERFAGGGVYLNFPGLAGEADELLRSTFGENYQRLREVKQKYDPGNLFRGNFNIAPAGAEARRAA